jgi:hypothetical protein
MASEFRADARPSDALSPSRVASVATLISAAAATVGAAGQLAVHGSVGFVILAGFGLAVLAAIVLAHRQ